jgi:ABC-type bacteriocin/lantibiotic exporter with double-glycine peptidase domain
LNWLRRHYTMLMIAQRLSTVARAHWIILLTKAGSQSKLPRRNPRAVGCLLAKLHDAKNNEMGSHVFGDP